MLLNMLWTCFKNGKTLNSNSGKNLKTIQWHLKKCVPKHKVNHSLRMKAMSTIICRIKLKLDQKEYCKLINHMKQKPILIAQKLKR